MSREAWLLLLTLGALLLLAGIVVAAVLAVRVWRTRQLLTELGAAGKFAFYGALIYTIFPIDLLPDPIYLDDVGVLTGALIYLTKLVRQHRAAQAAMPAPGTGNWPDPRRFAVPRVPRPGTLSQPGGPVPGSPPPGQLPPGPGR
ncbi:YkvA family protein [Plantactinospora sp. KBS50]|uniref:YkvA family protein n=1 Tax=Plantactinospora sp. KBS50 TaxID=2024580 RepID=UPI0012FE7BBC|nr:YkvA family protein [Plantactinospora sp. KBS50]